jgi:hypothetical protein
MQQIEYRQSCIDALVLTTAVVCYLHGQEAFSLCTVANGVCTCDGCSKAPWGMQANLNAIPMHHRDSGNGAMPARGRCTPGSPRVLPSAGNTTCPSAARTVPRTMLPPTPPPSLPTTPHIPSLCRPVHFHPHCPLYHRCPCCVVQ